MGTNPEIFELGTGGDVSMIEKDQVNQPSHYQLNSNRQVIDILAETLTPEELRGFVLGNVLKYVTRSAYKGKELEDLSKAAWYLNWYVNFKTK